MDGDSLFEKDKSVVLYAGAQISFSHVGSEVEVCCQSTFFHLKQILCYFNC